MANVTKSGDVITIHVEDESGTTEEEVDMSDYSQKADVAADNAGAHNSIYRGKYLGTEVTADQYDAINAGTFTDLYIGDYWTINGVNYRIAAFDYYYYYGYSATTKHHVVIVPDTTLGSSQAWDDNGSTDGGYVNSTIRTTGLDEARNIIETAFGASHILSHQVEMTKALTDGKPTQGSNWSWQNATIELMTEQNIFGCSPVGYNWEASADAAQFPLFVLNPSSKYCRSAILIRSTVSATIVVTLSVRGSATRSSVTSRYGIRPSFCIVK